jgi:hypothetical protein
MWYNMKIWFEGEIGPVSIPDDVSLENDICSVSEKLGSLNRLLLKSKEEMKTDGISSPDRGDALALTFAWPKNEHASNVSALYNPTVRLA